MRALFDFVKNLLVKLDGYWIESAGHPIIATGVRRSKNDSYLEDREVAFEPFEPPVKLYAFYDYPKRQSYSIFCVDTPDEMSVQLNAETLLEKLGTIPEIGTELFIEDSKWLVINRAWIYNRFIGKYRLELICQQFQESTTREDKGIHIQTASRHTINEE